MTQSPPLAAPAPRPAGLTSSDALLALMGAGGIFGGLYLTRT